MPRAVVLVVDDDESGRFARAQVLRRAGFEVVEAGSGAEAFERLSTVVPDAIVLDVNLPDINGMEISRRVRSGEGDTSMVPILQVSSTAVSAAEQVKGLELGADVYVTEPIHPDVFVAAVRALVRVRRAERELGLALQRERAARLEAEEANATKNDFIATLSHELRTPLNALLGSVWQLRHAAGDEAARQRALDRIERSAAAQARLINDLLDLSRIARGKLTLALRLVDVADILEDSVDAVRPAAAQKRVTLQTTWDHVRVVADPDRLQQIFVNLLTNAVQFTPPGGVIRVSAGIDRRDVVIRVDDSGAGIAADFLPLVFEQFRQGEAGMSRKHGGLGLGLAVVKQLVDLHDGQVSVTSAGRDRGSSFTVRIPCESVATTAAEAEGRPLERVRVVLAPDADMPADLPAVLAAAGATVESVRDLPGVEAHVRGSDCDAVVISPTYAARLPASLSDARGRVPLAITAWVTEQPIAVVRRLSRGVRNGNGSAG
ncbi:MAG: sensor histidine kinase [Vicinamibacterales bacterium]